jgi:hypothetical protein
MYLPPRSLAGQTTGQPVDSTYRVWPVSRAKEIQETDTLSKDARESRFSAHGAQPNEFLAL